MQDEFKPEKFKVWYLHQVGTNTTYERPVPDAGTGRLVLDAIYDVMLHCFDKNMIPDYANVGGVQYLDEDGEWVDYDVDEWESA